MYCCFTGTLKSAWEDTNSNYTSPGGNSLHRENAGCTRYTILCVVAGLMYHRKLNTERVHHVVSCT